MKSVTSLPTLLGAHVALAIVSCSGGCGAASPLPTTPRGQARAAIRVLADGVAEADLRCAAAALDADSLPLAERCKSAYDAARASLLVAGGLVDSYDQGRSGDVQCATITGALAAKELLGAVRAGGGTIPLALEDGLELFASLELTCSKDGGP